MKKQQLKLGAFMRPISIHTGGWRYPGAFPDANFNLSHIKRLIRKLEHGKRGIFRREYEGATLRENLGLPRPENRFFPAHTPARRAAPPARAHSHS